MLTDDLLRVLAAFLAGVLCALPIAAYMRMRARLRRRIGSSGAPPVLDDEAIRRIEATGRWQTDEDEPLDLREIEAEEERFWREEDWDEAQEW